MLLASALFLSLASGCGQGQGAASQAAMLYPRESVELVAPAGVRSGSDLTLRNVAQCLRDTGLVDVPLPVTNRPGDGGGLALDYLNEQAGADNVLAVFSPPVCLIHLNGSTSLSYQENTTPIAKLITDYGCFAVAANSPYQNLNQVMEALREDPASVRVGGTSSAGSMDHVQFLKVAQSGDVRVLGITAEQRVGSGIVAEMPTCVEQGIDATFYNWRGIFGPKDMPEEARKFWEETLEKLVQTQEWADTCEKYGWDMDYLGRQEFEAFLAGVKEEYAVLLEQVGLLEAK